MPKRLSPILACVLLFSTAAASLFFRPTPAYACSLEPINNYWFTHEYQFDPADLPPGIELSITYDFRPAEGDLLFVNNNAPTTYIGFTGRPRPELLELNRPYIFFLDYDDARYQAVPTNGYGVSKGAYSQRMIEDIKAAVDQEPIEFEFESALRLAESGETPAEFQDDARLNLVSATVWIYIGVGLTFLIGIVSAFLWWRKKKRDLKTARS